MKATYTAFIVLAVVLGAGILGSMLRRILPESHVSSESWTIVGVGIGFISTMNAIVLGLLVASAKGSYDAKAQDLQEVAAQIIVFDRTLRQYGPETQSTRALLEDFLKRRTNMHWFRDQLVADNNPIASPTVYGYETIGEAVRGLSPANDRQREIRTRALQILDQISEKRWMFVAQSTTGVSTPLLVTLVACLAVISGCTGVFAPRHGMMLVVALLCAISISGTIFLIMSMYNPYSGLMELSIAPFERALQFVEQP